METERFTIIAAFTVGEELGLLDASGVQPAFVAGSKSRWPSHVFLLVGRDNSELLRWEPAPRSF